jgi:hypothetical protein
LGTSIREYKKPAPRPEYIHPACGAIAPITFTTGWPTSIIPAIIRRTSEALPG